jgi:uncharacterized iron-regulated membrane protein
MPNPRIWNRRLHRWGAIAVAIPFLIVISTGLLLQLKKQIPWVQPGEVKGGSAMPTLTLPMILEIVAAVPQAGISEWAHIDRIDVRPAKGMLKVVGKNRWEVQVDVATGAVLQTAYRRSDIIESLHDGSFFHDRVKLLVFLPAGVVVLGLWITGIYLWLLPRMARRENAERRKLDRRGARNRDVLRAADGRAVR